MAKNLLTENFSEPLDAASAARIDISAGDGNLTIDQLTGEEQTLVSGTVQYFENQGLPARSRIASDGQSTFTLKGISAGRPRFRFPWSACNGATDWQIHLNPTVSSDIIAHSDGGNLKLDLAGMAITSVMADTGGGNIDVILPEEAANLNVSSKTGAGNVNVEVGSSLTGSSSLHLDSGAGNVVVSLPGSMVARIHATIGLGKAIVDPHYSKVDDKTYQSPDFDSAADKIEITLKSGAGDVIVNTR